MNKSAYKRHAGKGKSIADRLRENGVISMSPKWNLIAINKLLIEKGIYTEKEFCDFCDKAEKEDEEMKLIKQAIALVKCLS